jgi:hypothetical protein
LKAYAATAVLIASLAAPVSAAFAAAGGGASAPAACPEEFEQQFESFGPQSMYTALKGSCSGPIEGDPGWNALSRKLVRVAVSGLDGVYEEHTRSFFPEPRADGTCAARYAEKRRVIWKTGSTQRSYTISGRTRQDGGEKATSPGVPLVTDGRIRERLLRPLPPTSRIEGSATILGHACERLVQITALPGGDASVIRSCVPMMPATCPAAAAMQPLELEVTVSLKRAEVAERGRTIALRTGRRGEVFAPAALRPTE